MILELHDALNSFSNSVLTATAGTGNIWDWIKSMVGQQAGTTIQVLVSVLVYGLVLYLDGIQVLRLMTNFGNRNNENAGIRNEARESIKSSFFIIACVTVIGAIGFTALTYFIQVNLGTPT